MMMRMPIVFPAIAVLPYLDKMRTRPIQLVVPMTIWNIAVVDRRQTRFITEKSTPRQSRVIWIRPFFRANCDI